MIHLTQTKIVSANTEIVYDLKEDYSDLNFDDVKQYFMDPTEGEGFAEVKNFFNDGEGYVYAISVDVDPESNIVFKDTYIFDPETEEKHVINSRKLLKDIEKHVNRNLMLNVVNDDVSGNYKPMIVNALKYNNL